MLKKVNRLARAKDIQKAFARGRTFFNPFFTIKFLPKANEQRFTVVVSTKVFKSAVARNRIKRLIREHLRKNLKVLPSGSYAIIVKPRMSSLPEPERLKSFLEVFGKIKA